MSIPSTTSWRSCAGSIARRSTSSSSGSSPPQGLSLLSGRRSAQLRGQFHVPHDAEPGEQPHDHVAEVELPPMKAQSRRIRVVMVVVVPAFADGEETENEVVAAVIGGAKRPRAV